MKILVLQHVPFEGPASIKDWANMRDHELIYCNLFEGDSLPNMDTFSMLLIMGGPMGVADEERYPWLVKEKAFIREAISQFKIVLGICLGAQLIADVMGAEVRWSGQREIGWFPLQKEGTHPLNKHFDGETVFHWHGDTFQTPSQAQRLASSDACANQAFIYNDRVLALQFHLEFVPDIVRRLVEHCADELDGTTYVQNADEMLRMPMRFAKLNQALYRLLDDWLQNHVGLTR